MWIGRDRMLEPASTPSEKIAAALIWTLAVAVSLIFLLIVGNIVGYGISEMSWESWVEFLVSLPRNSGRAGGISSILVSTSLILGVCLAVSLPIGLGTAIFLSEYASLNSIYGRGIRRSLDVLAGVPSIIFGLFGNAFFCKFLGLGFSILSGGLTLACMVLPILTRSVEEGLRSVPQDYRFSSASLAFSRMTTLTQLLLPLAVPGVVVGLVLGVGRAIAETAALIFTSGYVDRMPDSLMDSGRAISIHIFDLAMNVPGGDANAYKSTLVLLFLVLLINGLSAVLADRWLARKVTLK